MMRACAVLALPALLACGRPATDVLRQRPAPPLDLEVSLPEGPHPPGLKRAYLAAFQEQFQTGLARRATPSAPGRIQLLVVIGSRAALPKSEDTRNRVMDEASALASGSPLRILHSTLSPRSDYEQAVAVLGYRPGWITGQVFLLKTGRRGFKIALPLDPMRIIQRMHPLGTEAQADGGIALQEGNAVALETLALLKKHVGWAPPRA